MPAPRPGFLTPTLCTPQALFRKLEREQYRAFHSSASLHKADHFYNFCVTAQSMRDHMLEHLGLTTASERSPLHDRWSKLPLLVGAADIANSAKHFVLRKPDGAPKRAKSKGVRRARGVVVSIYQMPDGRLITRPKEAPDILVKLSDGSIYPLWQFTVGILDYWRGFMKDAGLSVRRQSFSSLSGA